MRLAVMIPTRGTIFTNAFRALLKNLKGLNYRLFTTTNHSVAEARDLMLKKALKGNYTHFFFTDDDVVLPPLTIKKMIEVKVPVVACEIPLKENGLSSVAYCLDGSVQWAGTGCLMVQREAIANLEYPYFNNPLVVSNEGGEDINFCRKLNSPIIILEGVIPQHLEIIQYGDLYKGLKAISRHKIKIHKRIKR